MPNHWKYQLSVEKVLLSLLAHVELLLSGLEEKWRHAARSFSR